MKQDDLKRKQLEDRLEKWRVIPNRLPPEGWVKEIRQAIGMSTSSLANRLGISRQSLSELEAREREGTATIEALKRAAEKLDADLVYAIVPRKRLMAQREDQARQKAEAQVSRIAHSMALEDQATSKAERERLIRERTRELLDEGGHRLWQDD